MADPIELPLDNDFDFEVTLKRKNLATRQRELVTGLLTLKTRLSLTKSGPLIDATLDLVMAEAANKPGTYFCTFDGDKLKLHLAAKVGQKVYGVFGDGTNIFTNTTFIVRAIRELA